MSSKGIYILSRYWCMNKLLPNETEVFFLSLFLFFCFLAFSRTYYLETILMTLDRPKKMDRSVHPTPACFCFFERLCSYFSAGAYLLQAYFTVGKEFLSWIYKKTHKLGLAILVKIFAWKVFCNHFVTVGKNRVLSKYS